MAGSETIGDASSGLPSPESRRTYVLGLASLLISIAVLSFSIVTLVVKLGWWNHRPSPSAAPVPSGEAADEPVDSEESDEGLDPNDKDPEWTRANRERFKRLGLELEANTKFFHESLHPALERAAVGDAKKTALVEKFKRLYGPAQYNVPHGTLNVSGALGLEFVFTAAEERRKFGLDGRGTFLVEGLKITLLEDFSAMTPDKLAALLLDELSKLDRKLPDAITGGGDPRKAR